MTTRSMITSILIAAAVCCAGTVWYLHRDTPPGCTSDAAMNKVYEALHNDFRLDSIYLNNIRSVAGGYFSDRHDCSAEVATIQGNRTVADLPWRAVRYSITHRADGDGLAVTTTLGGVTPFVEQKLSFWQRLLGGR